MSIEDQINQIEALRDKALSAYDRAVAAAEKHRKEAEEYATAIDVLNRIAPPKEGRINLAQRIEASSFEHGKGPIWKRILDLMKASEKVWWTANELQDAFEASGEPVKMTSISPNLSRLKDDGKIVRDDLKVALADRARQNAETPEGDLLGRNPSGASNHDRPYQSVEPPAQGREAGPGGGT